MNCQKMDHYCLRKITHTLIVSENGTLSVKIFYEKKVGKLKDMQMLTFTIDITTIEVIMGTKPLLQSQKIYFVITLISSL